MKKDTKKVRSRGATVVVAKEKLEPATSATAIFNSRSEVADIFDVKDKECIAAVEDEPTGVTAVKLVPPGRRKSTTFEGMFKAINCVNVDFKSYHDYIHYILSATDIPEISPTSLLFNTQAYNILKAATQMYVSLKYSVIPRYDITLAGASGDGILPYFERVLAKFGITSSTKEKTFLTKFNGNRAELIWSYWMEEGMLVQTMNAISRRIQNVGRRGHDPLANLEIDSLRPLTNILFGYIQDAPNRLSISRRNYEYLNEYGIQLLGGENELTPASVRTNFLEFFHNLLYQCLDFYRVFDDLTKNADAYPLLNSLQEVNLLLMHGMHNQYNDLSIKARSEMLLEQFILSRKEMNEFLHGKPMVMYDEPWMSTVDTMREIQGWPGMSIRSYHELAVCGEKLLLSIRYFEWNNTEVATTDAAKSWATLNREMIQRYIHNYKSVTGVDIAEPPTSGRVALKGIMPGLLIQQRFQKDRMLKRG